MAHGTLQHATPMIADLATLANLLSREQWRIESITVRLHVLRMAVSGDWPGSVDDADAGLADAVDRLRRDELARAVLSSGFAERFGVGVEPTLSQLLISAPEDLAGQLVVTADGLAHAIEAARDAARQVARQLQDAAYGPATGARPAAVTPTRAAVIDRLLHRIIPASIERFLGLHVG